MANPDGYMYSMIGDSKRMTRKNRHRGFCSDPDNDGVDLNRNFGVGFNLKHNPQCSPSYPGPSAFSEPESKAIRDAMSHNIPWLALSVHGNGQAWAYPYAYEIRETPFPHKNMLKNVVENIRSKFGTNYKFGQSSHVEYEVGGTLTDWIYKDLNVTRTFLHELKSLYEDDEEGFDHFQPPINQVIQDIVPEAWYGFKNLVKYSYQDDCQNTSK